MNFEAIETIINADGLRLVLVRGLPSPWGQATKAMMEYKGLAFLAGSQMPGAENPELESWAGENSAPVVAWNDEPPLTRWNDIMLLLERLAPERPLIPTNMEERVLCFGLAHELCGQWGFGWHRRLDMFHLAIQAGAPEEGMPAKYGYNAADGAAAKSRVDQFLVYLTERLQSQAEAGSDYLIGNSVSAVDFYWAAFSNLLCLQPDLQCPLRPEVRDRFEAASAAYRHYADSPLIAHRDRIMQQYFKMPMEL